MVARGSVSTGIIAPKNGVITLKHRYGAACYRSIHIEIELALLRINHRSGAFFVPRERNIMASYYILVPLILLKELGPEAALIAAAIASNRPNFESFLGLITKIAGCARKTAENTCTLLESKGFLLKGIRGWTPTKKYDDLRKTESIKLPLNIAGIYGISAAQKIIMGYFLTYDNHSMSDMEETLGFDDSKIRYSFGRLLEAGYIRKVATGGGRGNSRKYEVLIACEIDPSPVSPRADTEYDIDIDMREYEFAEALSEMQERFHDAAYFDIAPDVLEAAINGMAKLLANPPSVVEVRGKKLSCSEIRMCEKYADLTALEAVSKRICDLRKRGKYEVKHLEDYVAGSLLFEAYSFATKDHP